MTKRMKPNCIKCGDEYSIKRHHAGYKTCLWCGEEDAREARSSWCVAPMHKSNYVLITNTDDLAGLNNKGGIVK